MPQPRLRTVCAPVEKGIIVLGYKNNNVQSYGVLKAQLERRNAPLVVPGWSEPAVYAMPGKFKATLLTPICPPSVRAATVCR
jgi:hypothetical protein